MSGQRQVLFSIVFGIVATIAIVGLAAAANERLSAGLEEHPEEEQEMEQFYRENKDEREPMEGPYRFALKVDGEQVTICEAGLESYEANKERIANLMLAGEWEEMDRYCPLTEEGQEIVDRGEVDSAVRSLQEEDDS